MLPMKVRVQGLKVALSSKMTQVRRAALLGRRPAVQLTACSFLQSYLHVVDSFHIPTPEPGYLLDLLRLRHWGESVLLVHQ